MISLSHLNKLIFSFFLLAIFTSTVVFGEEEPVDIWKKKENQKEQNEKNDSETEITIESPILSEDISKIDFPAPAKLIKQEISNDKLITLK